MWEYIQNRCSILGKNNRRENLLEHQKFVRVIIL